MSSGRDMGGTFSGVGVVAASAAGVFSGAGVGAGLVEGVFRRRGRAIARILPGRNKRVKWENSDTAHPLSAERLPVERERKIGDLN